MCYPHNCNDFDTCNPNGQGRDYPHGEYMPPMAYPCPASPYDRGYGAGKTAAMAVGVGVGAILTYWLITKLRKEA